ECATLRGIGRHHPRDPMNPAGFGQAISINISFASFNVFPRENCARINHNPLNLVQIGTQWLINY
ncbi:hypothetical protein NBH19_25935, partial [Rhizobium sp. S95]